MITFLLLAWDGFLLLGEGFGLSNRRAERFADTVWIGSAVLVLAWLASMVTVGVQL